MNLRLAFRLCGALTLLLSASAAVGAPLVVQNAGFELPALNNLAFTRFSQTTVPGWSVIGGRVDEAGVQDFVTSGEFAGGVFTQGVNDNVLWIQGSRNALVPSVVAQTLGDTLQAGTIYTLSVDVADRPTLTGPRLEGNYVLQLWSNNVLLAETRGQPPTNPTTGGTFTTFNVTFDTLNDPLPAGAVLGGNLQIRLSNDAVHPSQPPQVLMDNIAVDASATALVNQWGAAAGGAWSTAGNWTGASVPNGAAATALLRNHIAGPATVTLDANVTLDTLELRNTFSSYTLASDGAHQLTLAGAAELRVAGTHSISTPIAGTSGLNKTGTGEALLTAVSSYTGVTQISTGTLSVAELANGGAASSMGASSSAAANLVIADRAALRYVGAGDSTNRMFTIDRGVVTLDASGTGAVNFTNTGAIELSGAGTRLLALTGTNDAANTLSASLGDAGGATSLAKYGDGRWILDGANSYTGMTTIDGGALQVRNAATLGAATGATTVAVTATTAGTLELAGSVAISGETLNLPGRQLAFAQATHVRNVSGNNTWAGPVVGAGGGEFYNLASDSGMLTISGSLTTPNSAGRTWRLTGDGDGQISGAIVQTGTAQVGIRKEGGGIWTLSAGDANNNFTGPTLVKAGILKIADSLTPDAGEVFSSSVTVEQGGALDTTDFDNYSMQIGQVFQGSGVVAAQNLVMYDDNVINPGNDANGAAGTLTIDGNLSIQNVFAVPVGGLTYDLASVADVGNGVNDLIAVTGDLSVDASLGAVPITINYVDGAIAGGGVYRLMNYGGAFTGNSASFAVANPARGMVIDTSVPGQINLTAAGTPANLVWVGGAGNLWDVNASQVWSRGGTPDVFFALDNVTFDNTGDNSVPVSLTGVIVPGTITVNANKDYELAGAGMIAGIGALNKSGTGTLIISNTSANTFSGGVNIQGGTVRLSGAANRLPTASAVTIGNVAGATLDLNGVNQTVASLSGGGAAGGAVLLGSSTASVLTINGDAATTFAGTISGAGGLTYAGSGSLALTGANSYDGATNINSGALAISNSAALGSTTGNTVVAGGATAGSLRLSGSIAVAEPISLAGRGAVQGENLAPHVVNVSGENTWNGDVTAITGGNDYTFQSDAGKLTVAGEFVNALSAIRTLSLLGAGNGEYSGAIGNTGASITAVYKDGDGAWTLSGANAYAGQTRVLGGTLLVNSTTGTGATIVESGGTLGGDGTVAGLLSVNAGGVLSPGASPGASIGSLQVVGDVAIDGVLAIDVLGLDADSFTGAGALTLGAGSVLEITGALTAPSYTIAMFASGGLSGVFGDASDVLSQGYTISYELDRIVLELATLMGDANGDGTVDIFDVAVVSNNWGSSGPTGDVNHDGSVDIFDVAVISNNWGAMSGTAAAVPEPGACGLMLAGVAAAACTLGRKRGSRREK